MSKQKICQANDVLLNKITEIRTVSEWASLMGWERSEFSRVYRRIHCVNAKSVLNKEKLRLIQRLMGEYPDAKSYEIACETGFKDEKALYDYVRYHKRCSPRKIRDHTL